MLLHAPPRPLALADVGQTTLPMEPPCVSSMQVVVRLWQAAVPDPVPSPCPRLPSVHLLPCLAKHHCTDASTCAFHGVLADQVRGASLIPWG